MILWELLATFFKVGLFTIGGGYAMLPLIQEEITAHHWLTAEEFVDIIAIAEMTPGAIAVNTATFVGFRLAGIPGALTATTAIALPSLLIIITLAGFWEHNRHHPIMKSVFGGIRPVVAGLIASAALTIGRSAIQLDPLVGGDGTGVDVRSVVVAVLVFVGVRRFRLQPIRAIVLSAVAGLVLFGLF